MSLRRIARLGRTLAPCALLPMFLLSSLTTQAVLIHDHPGYETHTHTVSVDLLGEWTKKGGHALEAQGHDHFPHFPNQRDDRDRPMDTTEDEIHGVVITLNVPAALVPGQGLPNRLQSPPVVPATIIPVVADAASINVTSFDSGSSCARTPRACGTVAGILLTSRALLL